ncbi:MAG: peptidylprolyl isomerase [Gammaproteobacteria bacterium HGW-Gammaproteobacteria-14]|nr:MAG: peptidylprolyl isomerase [Gammaproteobacteria bacterium HGW-Gammaproteobacteria-14]
MSIPEFRDQQGQFSAMQFEQLVRNAGMTQRTFVAGLRLDLLLNQVRAGFEDTDFALPSEVAEQRRLAEQTRDIRYSLVRAAQLGASLEVSDAEVNEFYQSNGSSFMRPEALKLEYVAVDPARFESEIDITDEQIEAEYAVRRAAMEEVAARAERRRAAHILVAVNDDRTTQQATQLISSLRDRLEMGEDFAELAKEASDDRATANNGGDLGPVGRGDLPESMEQALFALAEGDVSAPVRTDAGLHLVRLVSVQARELPTVEQNRDAIVADLRRNELEFRVTDVTDQLADLALAHSDLEMPAEALGLDVEQTEWLTPGTGRGLLANAAVREVLASDAVRYQGYNSDIIQLDDGRYIVLRLAEVKPEELRPLSEVRGDIVAAIRRERALSKLDQLASSARESIDAGADLKVVAALLAAPVSTEAGLTRNATSPSQELVRAAFRLSHTAVSPQVLRLANGDLVALVVDAVNDGGGELSEQEHAMALAELAEAEGRRSLRHVLGLLRDTTKVKVYENRLNANAEDTGF